jgi:hypothetical protein
LAPAVNAIKIVYVIHKQQELFLNSWKNVLKTIDVYFCEKHETIYRTLITLSTVQAEVLDLKQSVYVCSVNRTPILQKFCTKWLKLKT